MSKRKPLSKTLRFEVFKRDRFTCQYCGAKAPEVVLHADHIQPVSKDGDNTILNLVTACAGCNGGKGARLLDDRSAVERQRGQIEELEERREQLEMMLAWRDAAQAETIDVIDEVCERIGERGGYWPNESGKADIRRWLKKYTLREVLVALDEAFDYYLKFNGAEPTLESWGVAFRKIPAFANMNRQVEGKPYLPRLLYIQGILRKRLEEPRENFVDALELIVRRGGDLDAVESAAKAAFNWPDFVERIRKMAEAQHGREV